MLFDIQNVPLGQKLSKTIISAIFLVFVGFGLVLVKILNPMTETVSTEPHTPQNGFKTLRYPGGLAFRVTLVLYIY